MAEWQNPPPYPRSVTPLPPQQVHAPPIRDALEGEGPPRRLQKPLDRRLEEVAKAVGGGYCRLQMPLNLALAVRETVAGHRLGDLGGGGGGNPPPFAMHPCLRLPTYSNSPHPIPPPLPRGHGSRRGKT